MLPSPDLLTRSCFGLVLLCVKLCIVTVTSGCNGYMCPNFPSGLRRGKVRPSSIDAGHIHSAQRMRCRRRGEFWANYIVLRGYPFPIPILGGFEECKKHVKAMNPIYRVCLLLLHFCVFSFHVSVCPFRKGWCRGVCSLGQTHYKCGQTVGSPFSRTWGLMDACQVYT